MTIGIVGSEQAKFTAATEGRARRLIDDLIISERATKVVSGACHLGGVDAFAIEEATALGIPTEEFPPISHSWPHYKKRNLQIVEASDMVVCVTLRTLPPSYTGVRFALCYHCGTRDHVKSGGCWTVKQAIRQGKRGLVFVVDEPSATE